MIEAGDVVYHCIKWIPGEIASTMRGKGTVTLIVDDSTGKRARVLWETGEILWLPTTELVREQNLLTNNRD